MSFTTTPAFEFRSPEGGATRRSRLSIAGGTQAPERARAWLRNAVAWLGADVEKTVALLISELVNNAVRHGGADHRALIQVEVRSFVGGVGVEVSDPGPGFAPRHRERPLDEPGGWGLVLVDELTERWGVLHDGGTTVWFELTLAG